MTSLGRHEDGVAKEFVQRLALAPLLQLDAIAYLMHRDLRSLPIEILELLEHMHGSPRLLRRAENLEPVPPAHHLTIEILLKDADELIPPSEQTVRFLLILKINDLLHRLFLSQKTNHLHATYRKETTIWNYKPFPLCAQEDGQTYRGWFSHMHGEPTRDIKIPCRSMTHVKSSITAKADGELPDFYDAGRHTKEVLPFLKPPTRRFTPASNTLLLCKSPRAQAAGAA